METFTNLIESKDILPKTYCGIIQHGMQARSDGRQLDHHTLQIMRQQAVKAMRSGQTVSSVQLR